MPRGGDVPLSEAEKIRLLSGLPCVNVGHCKGPPKCYAHHSNDIASSSNHDEASERTHDLSDVMVPKVDAKIEGKEDHNESDGGVMMRLAIAESLKPQKFQCQWCKMMLDTREELDLHRYNDCSEIGHSLQPSEPQADESPRSLEKLRI